MTDKYLKSLIDKLNRKKTDGSVFLRPLSERVDLAKVITKVRRLPTKDISPLKFESFYFIKNDDGCYVASVYPMGDHDIHWFVLHKHRKKGHLTRAMREIILAHLFQEHDELRITINENMIGRINSIASEKVAMNLGFTKVTDSYYGSEYILDYKEPEEIIDLSGRNTGITKERLKELQNLIHSNLNSLLTIQTEIDMKIGSNLCTEELEYFIGEIRKHPNAIEDIWWERKMNWENK